MGGKGGSSLSVAAFTGNGPGHASAQGLLTLRPALPLSRYGGPSQGKAFHQELLERLRALPEVESATVRATVPFAGSHNRETLHMEGWGALQDHRHEVVADIQAVGPDFFRVLGITPL
ncbi:MAG: hypothetical protein V3T83_01415 [Acidobacteriota bacterium]